MDMHLEYIGLFSIMLLSTSMAGCPSRCICSKNAVRCTERSLLDIPNFETLDNDPVTIDLSSNDIDFITHYALSFDKAEMVEILYLNDSKIIDIDDTAFKELISLRELYLSNNLLSDLPANSFRFNDNLTYLDLSFNLFRDVPKIISSCIKSLNLINSGIENVDPDRFTDLPNLQYLYLQRNNIRYIDLDMLKYLPKLTRIELEYNAWKCNCESVEMFNVLKSHELISVKDEIHCRSENDFFITMFNKFGPVQTVKELCMQNKEKLSYNFGGEFDETEEIPINLNPRTKTYKKDETHRKRGKTPKRNSQYTQIKIPKTQDIQMDGRSNTTCEIIEYISPFTISAYIIFCTALVITFIIGLIVGSLVFGQNKNVRVSNDSSSCNSLLKREKV